MSLSSRTSAAYVRLRGYWDIRTLPEAEVEAVRDWLVLVNFHDTAPPTLPAGSRRT
jgi:hypothetical protein